MVIPLFLDQRRKHKPLTVVGDGTATRDYVHVSDVVAANILAWKSTIGDGSVFNIGSGKQTSVNQIARIIGGKTVSIPPRHGEMEKIEASIVKAKELLGWEPMVSLEEGIKELNKE